LIEIVLVVALCALMGRVAELDGHSPSAWIAITLGLCLITLAIPIPIIRVLLGGIAAYAIKFTYNFIRSPAVK
jgi:hypothetical protein